MSKLWFSITDFSFNYKGTEEAFMPPENFDWASDISKNTGQIKIELNNFLEKNKPKNYFNSTMVSQQGTWKTIPLKAWSVELFKNQNQFPFTTALINKHPEIISASFNLLEPKGAIVAHCGDTNAIYRCHLGLDIPAGLPLCGLKVKDESRAWKNGEWIIFIDAYTHEAWNYTTEPRYIFLIDILRDEFKNKKKEITSTVLTSLFIQKKADQLKFIHRFQSFPATAKIITFLLRPFALIAILISNKLKLF